VYVPTARIDHKIDNLGYQLWLTRIDQIIRQRLDRKGIIHTVSYARRDRIMNVSEYSDIFYTHETRNIQKSLIEFKQSDPPAVLVSPSVITGWDFPYDTCEYQIIGKIPFPDLRRKVDKERRKRDKDIGCCFAMQDLVQACGRGNRHADDRCQCLIIDDHFRWFLNKYRHFAPKWFLESIQFAATIPTPLTKIRR
jgi:Rad3-related DNA helicase